MLVGQVVVLGVVFVGQVAVLASRSAIGSGLGVLVSVVGGDLVCLVVVRGQQWARPSRSAISSGVPPVRLSAVSPRLGALAR